MEGILKPIWWIGQSKDELMAFPKNAIQDAGYQLHRLQEGNDPQDWRPLTGLGKGITGCKRELEMKQQIITGSVFDDLEPDPGKAEQLKIKAALFDAIIAYIKENGLTQEQAAEIMGVQRSRIGDVCRGKMSGFSIDALVSMAARAGLHPLKVAA